MSLTKLNSTLYKSLHAIRADYLKQIASFEASTEPAWYKQNNIRHLNDALEQLELVFKVFVPETHCADGKPADQCNEDKPCESCCEHDDVCRDERICLICDKDMTEDLACAADDYYEGDR